MINEIIDKEDRALSPFLMVLRVVGYLIAFAPLTLSVWVFHYNRAQIQNGLVGEDMSGTEIANPILEQWMQFRSAGNFFYFILILVVVFFLLLYLYNRNRHLKNVIRIISTDVIIGTLLLTFSYAIGAYLTDIYLLLLNVVGV